MRNVLSRARESFARNERGNVAILFAMTAIPLVGLLGGAVDMTRYARYKTQIASAMDAAAIALVRNGADNDAEADRFVNAYMAAMLPSPKRDKMLHLRPFDSVQIEGGYRVVADGSMDTAFMPVIGIRKMHLDLVAEVVMSTGKYELALALDNTGSMAQRGRIDALREAAGVLVDDLYREEGTRERVKMALVPFVTAVNIKSLEPGVFDPDWINPTGRGGDFAFGSADRLQLFDDMNVEWDGCVEARTIDEETDSAPETPATRWVPYLWPDEPDRRGYGNDYLDDGVGGPDLVRLRNTGKYRVGAGVRVPDTTSRGPNAACPRPIVELTNDTDRLHDEIDRMVPHNRTGGNSSGTNVAQGLLWAWRVLSPGQPFDQGVPYSDETTTKALVLLSDGRNQIVPDDDVTGSDYTSYGYLAAGRMKSSDNYLVAERAVDEKVKSVCEKVKARGIRLYTILFEVDFPRTQDLFRDCASKNEDGEPLYYYVPAASDLETAFRDIGDDLTSLRIAR